MDPVKDTVKDSLRRFIVSGYLPGESPDSLHDDTPLQTSGILDSLATIGLVAFVEKEFGVMLDVYDTSVDNFDSVEAIAQVVMRKRATCKA